MWVPQWSGALSASQGGCGPSAHRLTLLGSVAPKAFPGVHVLHQPSHWTGASALPEAARRRCRPLKGLVARHGPHLVLYRCGLLVLWNSGPRSGENDPGPRSENTACAREGGFTGQPASMSLYSFHHLFKAIVSCSEPLEGDGTWRSLFPLHG